MHVFYAFYKHLKYKQLQNNVIFKTLKNMLFSLKKEPF